MPGKKKKVHRTKQFYRLYSTLITISLYNLIVPLQSSDGTAGTLFFFFFPQIKKKAFDALQCQIQKRLQEVHYLNIQYQLLMP